VAELVEAGFDKLSRRKSYTNSATALGIFAFFAPLRAKIFCFVFLQWHVTPEV